MAVSHMVSTKKDGGFEARPMAKKKICATFAQTLPRTLPLHDVKRNRITRNEPEMELSFPHMERAVLTKQLPYRDSSQIHFSPVYFLTLKAIAGAHRVFAPFIHPVIDRISSCRPTQLTSWYSSLLILIDSRDDRSS